MSDELPNLWARHCEAHTKNAVEGEVVGNIPSWLNGRLIRNGPGGKKIGECHFNHLFDGMSVLHMVNIENGKATYVSRYLESDANTKNNRANRIVVSEFGTAAVLDPCARLFDKFKSMFVSPFSRETSDNCSVNIMQLKDEIMVMIEYNTVRIIDPVTLDTKPQKYSYSDYVAVNRATAHPHVTEDGTIFNLGFGSKNRSPHYVIVAMPERKFEEAKIVASVPSRWKLHPGYMHSFGMTENYFILVESPMCINLLTLMMPAMTGVTALKALKYYRNENTRFRVISRQTGKELETKYMAPAFFNFHFMNCYEVDGCIVVDLCASNDNIVQMLKMDNLKKVDEDPTRSVTSVEPRRYVLPVHQLEEAVARQEILANFSKSVIGNESKKTASAKKLPNGDIFVEPLKFSDTAMEFPRINYKFNTKCYKYAYGACLEKTDKTFFDFDGIIKLNVETCEEVIWQDKEYFSSEPVFVEKPDPTGEDDGVIITILLHKTHPRKLVFLVLDAVSLTELARVSFLAEGTVTSTFHGEFLSGNLNALVTKE